MEKRQGSPYDRGAADAYYHRPPDPHYYKLGRASQRVEKKDMSDEQRAEYLLGHYEEHDRKDFGEFNEE